MLESLLRRNGKYFAFHWSAIKRETNEEFVDAVYQVVKYLPPPTSAKFAEEGKARFVYLQLGHKTWVSFSHNLDAQELWFAVRKGQKPWKQVIGFKLASGSDV